MRRRATWTTEKTASLQAAVASGEMIKLRDQGYTYQRLAERYGVSESTIARTLRGENQSREYKKRERTSHIPQFVPTPAQKLALCTAW